VNISNIDCGIPKLKKLKRDNYKFWKEKVLLHLGGLMDIENAIRELETWLLMGPTLKMLLIFMKTEIVR